MESKEWTAQEWTAEPGAELRIPEQYLTDLRYDITVLSSKKLFLFRCVGYSLDGNICTFHGVIIDTSKRNARGAVTLQRVSYHERVVLANVGFMAIPVPTETGVSEQFGD